jgi:hypothetical protein
MIMASILTRCFYPVSPEPPVPVHYLYLTEHPGPCYFLDKVLMLYWLPNVFFCPGSDRDSQTRFSAPLYRVLLI